jgi:hypothetical protein
MKMFWKSDRSHQKNLFREKPEEIFLSALPEIFQLNPHQQAVLYCTGTKKSL